MFNVLTCIVDKHDPRLLIAALVICVVSAATGLSIYAHATASHGVARIRWSVLGGFITGSGVWATHFLFMLSTQSDVSVSYAFDTTALSLCAAVAILSCGLFTAANSETPKGRGVGGAIIGAGIAAMHLIGVSAMTGAVILSWDYHLLAAALFTALGASAAAISVAGRGDDHLRRWIGAGFLVVAICGLHFTAMAATTIVLQAPLAGRDVLPLAVATGGVVGLLIMAAIGMMAISRNSIRTALLSVQSALDAAPVAMSFFDHEQRLMFWNRQYSELLHFFGVTPVVGLRFADMLGSATAAGIPYKVTPKSALAGDFAWGGAPDEFGLPDGRVIHAKMGPTRDGGFIAVLSDVTLTHQAEKLANEARERAESANQSKSDFLANMSHEIRTPLNGVLGMGQLMAANALEPGQRERLKVIMASGETLLALLNDLLDLAKVEAGQLELEDVPFDMEATLRPALEAFSAVAAQKAVAFNATILPEAAGQWRGDPLRLRQVVTNLVSNAVKFTSKGEVTLVVNATATGLRITVSDTGIGMKADQIPTLFDRFTQADSSTTRVFGGSGLGLSICRDIAQVMGGELTVESREGFGSTFTFNAPLSRGRADDARAESTTARPQPRSHLRILAAEDNPTNQLVLRSMLETLHVDLVMTCDGEAAVAAYEAGAFDLVLMDIQMPKLGGIEATAAIRALEAEQGFGHTPIIALTANVMAHQIGDYYAAGMDAVVAKPVEIGKLFAAIENALPMRQAA